MDRTELIQMRVTPETKTRWRLYAAASGKTLTRFIEEAVPSSEVYDEAREALREAAELLTE